MRTAPASSLAVREIRVVTFDFGNTLVPVDRVGLGRVVELTAGWAVARLGASDVPTFLRVWAEERDRQFREEIPRFREADLAVRVVRVLARLRGGPAPAADTPWDDDAAVWWSDPAEVEAAVERYSRAFVEGLPPRPGIEPLLARLAVDRKLGILSNWPFAATIDRYALAAGWAPHLSAIVVSQRVGAIKPAPAIFDAALQALGNPEAAACLHVGDDWAADVVGAKRAGWKAAHVRMRPEDSPLPTSAPDGSVHADLEIDTLDEIERALYDPAGNGAAIRHPPQ